VGGRDMGRYRSDRSLGAISMRTRQIQVLSAATAGSLVLTAVIATASTHPARASGHAALAAEMVAAPAVNLDNCPTMALGYQGGCASQLQQELTNDGDTVPVDGIFGPGTRRAVENFQQEHDIIPADGIVGPQTKVVLDNPGAAPAAPTPGQLDPGGQITSGTQIASPDGEFVPWPGANSCRSHCYDRAVDFHSNLMGGSTLIQSTWFSMLDQTQAPYQTPVIDNSDCPGETCAFFISREMWLGGPEHWIEVGLRDGYEYPQWRMPNGAPGCGCQAYFQFWEDGPGPAGTYTNTHVIANITPDNAWHKYGISRVSGSTFDITVDGQVVGISTASGATSFDESVIGSETSGLTTVQPLSLMNMACQSWSVEDTSGQWFGVGDPNGGVVGPKDPYHGSLLAEPFHRGPVPGPDQTYFGGWNSASQQLCIGKSGL